jgi:hypothetical protein
VDNLMLHKFVRDEIDKGNLKIYPVTYVWEAFELITGVELGIKNIHDESFAKGSALDIIKQKLDKLHSDEDKKGSKSTAQAKEKEKAKSEN